MLPKLQQTPLRDSRLSETWGPPQDQATSTRDSLRAQSGS